MTDFKTIPLSEIKPDPNQPRKYYDELAMQELTDSIKQKGVLQPILLRPNGHGYILVCGERRYKAATSAGLKDIPAVIRQLSDDEALELQIIENLQRKDVHPMEEAVAFKSLLEKGKDIKEIAAHLGKTEYYARQRIKLCALSKDWQQVFFQNKISVTDALKVALFDDNIQKELFEEQGQRAGKIEIDSWTINKYMGELDAASFDLTDPLLYKKMGACTNCKYNSATAALFENMGASKCSLISCFTHKTDESFARNFNQSLEDPLIVFVHDSYGNVNDKFVTKAQNAGHKVYGYSEYNIIRIPQKPTWDDMLDNAGDFDSDEEMKAQFEVDLKEYEEDLADYNKQVDSGKNKKAFMLTGRQKGKFVYVKLTGKGATTASSKQTKEKEASGTLTIADIEEEITRLRDREKRAKELDAEKVREEVNSILRNSDKFTANNRDHKLTDNEIVAAAVALFEAGSFGFREWFGKNYKTDRYGLSIKNLENLKLSYLGLNEIIFHFIKDKLITGYGSRLKDAKALCIHNIAQDYHPNEVSMAVLDQDSKADRRQEKVNKRIAELQAQKKELQPKPTSKKPGKK